MELNHISADHIRVALAQYGGNQTTSDFDLNASLRPSAPKLRGAAVLIPLVTRPSGLSVVLTKRSSQLKHHPGQIAFAGGKIDPQDKTPLNAALREAEEEIGLPRDLVDVYGTLPVHETVTSFQVTPFVGMVTAPFKPVAEPDEVAEVFEVPLRLFVDPANFQIHRSVWGGVERRYYAVPYGPYYIWGATARIMRMFCDVIGGSHETAS